MSGTDNRTGSKRLAVYASVGPALHHYDVDVDQCALQKTSNVVSMPQNIQYAWPDAAGAHLYMCSSNVAKNVNPAAPSHHRQAFRIDPASGHLAAHGDPMPLKWRPVHMSLDEAGRNALVVYPNPTGATVHRILPDGRFGEDVPQPDKLNTGAFPHQVRMLPASGGGGVVVVSRGYNATADKTEEPGALRLYDYRDGVLNQRGAIAPAGGYGFGPRHIDYHPNGRWLYAALERQNRLHVFSMAGGQVTAEPVFVRDTLKDSKKVLGHQMVGTVHVHPNGKFVYVANRCSDTEPFTGRKVHAGGENSLAVYAIDPDTGEPTLIQHAEMHSIHVRTFAIDPSGRMLVAASISAMDVRDGAGTAIKPACLTTYRIAANGKVEFVNYYNVETSGDRRMFWMGMVSVGA